MANNMIQWRPIIIGTIIAVILSVLSMLSQGLLTADFLLAGIAVGFMVKGTIKEGTINGTIMGVIGAVIFLVILVIIYASQGYGALITSILSYLVLYVIADIVLAVAGGALGSLIRAEVFANPEEDLVQE